MFLDRGDLRTVTTTHVTATPTRLPRSALGRTHDIELPDPRGLPDRDRLDLDLGAPLIVLDRPQGQEITRLTGLVTIQRLGEPRDGHGLVAANFVLEQRSYAVGRISTSVLATRPRPALGGVVVGRDEHDLPTVRVLAGAGLRSEAGTVVGLVRRHMQLPCRAQCDGPNPVVQLGCSADFPVRVVGPD